MRHFLEKLTYTSALRLYRLLRNSQLLRRLGPDWYNTGYGDQPTLLPGGVDQPANSRTLRPTVLEALAQRVPSWGPRVDVVAVSPWEAPNWAARLNYMGVVHPYLRCACCNGSLTVCPTWTTWSDLQHVTGLLGH
jgi:hypothetical protein